ncbi:MAG TPA: hypothetical protein VJA94_03590 [Candidatus Angelobacter sp.]
MSRKLLLVLVLSASLTAFSQTGASPDQENTNPNQSSVVVPPTGGTAWTGIGPTGGVLLSTPSATFDSPQPTAGISLAGRAGISNNAPVNTGLESTLAPSSMVYVSMPAVSAPVNTPATESPALEAVPAERAPDLVPPATTGNFGAPPVTNNLSLAEVAAMYKARQATQTLRTYTNADVPRENAGLLTNTIMASNHVPPPPQSASTQSSASQSQSSSQQQETATQSAATENPQTAQDQAADENKGLPATSTLLPLLGLLGVASAGIGVWYRRRGR